MHDYISKSTAVCPWIYAYFTHIWYLVCGFLKNFVQSATFCAQGDAPIHTVGNGLRAVPRCRRHRKNPLPRGEAIFRPCGAVEIQKNAPEYSGRSGCQKSTSLRGGRSPTHPRVASLAPSGQFTFWQSRNFLDPITWISPLFTGFPRSSAHWFGMTWSFSTR